MCMSNNQRSVQKLVSAVGTTNQFVMVTKWMLLYGADSALVYEQLQRGGADADYRQEVCYRTAEVWTGEPSVWTGTGNVRSGLATAATPFSWTANVTTLASLWNGSPGKAMWIQFAVRARSNAAAVATSWSRLVVALDNKAKVAGGRTVQVQPDTNATFSSTVELTPWFSAQDLAAVMGAIRITGVTGTLAYQLVGRTLAGPGSYPGAWTTLGTPQTTATNTLFNTGDLSLVPGANLSAQVGLQFSGTVTATVQVVVGARYA